MDWGRHPVLGAIHPEEELNDAQNLRTRRAVAHGGGLTAYTSTRATMGEHMLIALSG